MMIHLTKKTITVVFLLGMFLGCATAQTKDLTTEKKDYKTVKSCYRQFAPIPIPPWGNFIERAIQKAEKEDIQSIQHVFFKKLALFTIYSQIKIKNKTENEFDVGKISLLDIYLHIKKKFQSIEEIDLKSNFSIAIYSQSCLVIVGE